MELVETTRELVVFVGLPRSGKSTAARQLTGWGIPCVNRDSVRRALHGQWWIPEAEGMVAEITKLMVKALFLAGHTQVGLDECNVTEKGRRAWLSKDWVTTFFVINTPPAVCKARRREDEWQGDFDSVIDRMAGEWEDPTSDKAY